jgi:beta-galactosidase GanA
MKKADRFVMAVHYYRQPTPLPEEWDGDMAKMRRTGITAIQLRPHWRWHERREGRFQWDDLDRLFDLSERHKLRIIFKFMLECAPDWLYRDYPATRVAPDGTKLVPKALGSMYPGGWLPCFDVPEVRERAARFVVACVERYRDRPSLEWWHAWNEPRSRPYGECACPASVRCYRNWLKSRFETVDKLNDFLGKCWDSFEDIHPPVSIQDYAEAFMWRHWAAQSVADRVRLVADACRTADPNHPVMAHVGCSSIIQDTLNDTSDDILTAATVDLYGSSLAAELDTGYGPEATPLNCDWIRSVNYGRRWWINEAYSNPNVGFRRDCGPDHVRHIFLTPLAHGASGVMAWQYRAERYGLESDDTGLVGFDGSETARSEEAARLGLFLRKYGNLFAGSVVPQPGIAVIYNFQSDLLSAIEDETLNCGPAVGEFAYSIPLGYSYRKALHGAYANFFRARYSTDVIDSRHAGRLSDGYKLAYLPLPFMADDALVRKLIEFAREGGTVVVEAGFRMREANTWMRAGAPGVEELPFTLKRHYRIREPGVPVVSRMFGSGPAVVTGPVDWLRCGEGSSAIPIGAFESGRLGMPAGSAAALDIALGKGRFVALAFSPGLNSGVPAMQSFVSALASDAGVSAPVRPSGPGAQNVIVRQLQTSDGRLATFLRNTGVTDAKLEIASLPAFDTDIWEGSKRAGARLVLPAGEFAVLVAERK